MATVIDIKPDFRIDALAKRRLEAGAEAFGYTRANISIN